MSSDTIGRTKNHGAVDLPEGGRPGGGELHLGSLEAGARPQVVRQRPRRHLRLRHHGRQDAAPRPTRDLH